MPVIIEFSATCEQCGACLSSVEGAFVIDTQLWMQFDPMLRHKIVVGLLTKREWYCQRCHPEGPPDPAPWEGERGDHRQVPWKYDWCSTGFGDNAEERAAYERMSDSLWAFAARHDGLAPGEGSDVDTFILDRGRNAAVPSQRVTVRLLENGLPASLRLVLTHENHTVSNVPRYILDRKGLPLEAPALPYGAYAVETDRGSAVLECRPAIGDAGQEDFERAEWYVRDMRLREEPKVLPAPRAPRDEAGHLIRYNQRCYILLYGLEVRLRWFVHEVMRSKYGEGWWDEEDFWRGMADKKVDKKKVKKVRCSFETARERLAEERKQPYVTLRETTIFAYMDFRGLRQIINTFWGDFTGHVPRKGIFLGMLETLEIIRNAVAHNRPVSAEAVAEVRKASQIVRKVVRESGMA